VLVLAATSGHALAWGDEGHGIAAEIAEQYLEPERARVRELLALNVLRERRATQRAIGYRPR
jgi:hypothetical protein